MLIIGILLLVLSTVAGAFGGRYLARRDLDRASLQLALKQFSGLTVRSNTALAQVETIAAEWPTVLANAQNAYDVSRRALSGMQAVTEQADEAVRRTDELESGIASALSISIPTTRRN